MSDLTALERHRLRETLRHFRTALPQLAFDENLPDPVARKLLADLRAAILARSLKNPQAEHKPLFRNGQPETAASAARYRPLKKVLHRVRLGHAFFLAFPEGLTDEEAGTASGLICQSSPHKRRYELEEDGFLIDSGQRRLTRLNCHAVVWVFVPGLPYLYWQDVVRGGLAPEVWFSFHARPRPIPPIQPKFDF